MNSEAHSETLGMKSTNSPPASRSQQHTSAVSMAESMALNLPTI